MVARCSIKKKADAFLWKLRYYDLSMIWFQANDFFKNKGKAGIYSKVDRVEHLLFIIFVHVGYFYTSSNWQLTHTHAHKHTHM